MDMSTIQWFAVLAAAVASFVIGGLWYGPLFGNTWMRASGMTEERAKEANMARIFGLSFVLQVIAAVVLAMFIGAEADLSFALMAAGSVGAFWVAPALGVIYLFEQRPLALWGVNAGYHVVSFLAMGAILGMWP